VPPHQLCTSSSTLHLHVTSSIGRGDDEIDWVSTGKRGGGGDGGRQLRWGKTGIDFMKSRIRLQWYLITIVIKQTYSNVIRLPAIRPCYNYMNQTPPKCFLETKFVTESSSHTIPLLVFFVWLNQVKTIKPDAQAQTQA
jgi:hypothetical protein